MRSVSILMNGDGATQSQIDQLYAKLKTFKEEDALVEFLLYFSETPSVTTPDPLIALVCSRLSVKSVQKAAATASGERLVFTTINNLLHDKANILVVSAQNTESAHVWAELRANPLEKLIGVRRLRHTAYIVVDKGFAVTIGKSLTKFPQIVKRADQQLALGSVPAIDANFPDFLVRNYVFVRPYDKIIIIRWRNLIQKIRLWNKARVEEKLRKRVKPALFTHSMPVFIICRDRVEPLIKLVRWCEDEGLTNIILVDNRSTYPPLLEYLSKTKHEVIWLNSNIGHTSPWKAGIVDTYAKDKPYIVSDPDVIPSTQAHGAVKVFCDLLNRHPVRRKVGFGLRIDDIPDSYELKDHVLAWEDVFWQTEVEKNVYDAEIDTTFAVYRPGTPYVLGPGLRTGGKYVARHEPWYIDSNNISQELRYYREHADKTVGSWGLDKKDVSTTYAKHRLKAGPQSKVVSPRPA